MRNRFATFLNLKFEKMNGPTTCNPNCVQEVQRMKLRQTTTILVAAAVVVLVVAIGMPPTNARAQTAARPAASSAMGEDVMYARLDQFFAFVSEGKVKSAYEGLAKGSKSISDIKPLVAQTENVILGNGEIRDAELLRTTRVGKRLLRISYLTHGDVYPMQWNFYCYQSAAGWQVLDITVNNDLYAIFAEEEAEQKKKQEKTTK